MNNEPFEAHASFFRNALVRANYRNRKAGVDADFTYLVDFMANVVEDAGIPLNDADPYCKPLFAHPELVRNVDRAFAAPLQAELKAMGITEAVLGEKREG